MRSSWPLDRPTQGRLEGQGCLRWATLLAPLPSWGRNLGSPRGGFGSLWNSDQAQKFTFFTFGGSVSSKQESWKPSGELLPPPPTTPRGDGKWQQSQEGHRPTQGLPSRGSCQHLGLSAPMIDVPAAPRGAVINPPRPLMTRAALLGTRQLMPNSLCYLINEHFSHPINVTLYKCH